MRIMTVATDREPRTESLREPQVERRAAQPCVTIAADATHGEWGCVTALVPEVLAWLHGRGVAMAGAPFIRHWVIGDAVHPARLEVGMPVAHAVVGDGRVAAGEIPAGCYAVLVHRGHPDRLPDSLDALAAWGAARGLVWRTCPWDEGVRVWGGRFEFHRTDPTVQPDRAQWETEIAWLLDDPPDLPANLGAPALRALTAAGLTRLEQLAGVPDAELRRLHGVGPAALARLRQALAAREQARADGAPIRHSR